MKNSSFLKLFIALLFFSSVGIAQEPVWLQKLKKEKWFDKVSELKILETNRTQAEQILGKPHQFDHPGSRIFENYSLKNGRVYVQYSTKICTTVNGAIARDSVEKFDFDLENNISFSRLVSRLKIPLKQFNRWSESDTPTEHYVDRNFGIDFAVQRGLLTWIEFSVPANLNYSCVTIPEFLNDLEKIKKINFLQTSRNDLRKLFADYEFNEHSIKEYNERIDTTSGMIDFYYSQGRCEFDDSEGYDAPEWSVEKIKVSPVNYINPKEFGIDLSKYQKEKTYANSLNHFVYHDKNQGISFEVINGKIDIINFFPQQKDYSKMCDKEIAKKLSSTRSIFVEDLKDRIFFSGGGPAFVHKLHLSKKELTIDCSSESLTNENCQGDFQPIKVVVQASDPQNDILTYAYTVTGGKIIGKGAKVKWDLSGVKPGIYKITAGVDDGCGICGKAITKTVIVKKCSKC